MREEERDLLRNALQRTSACPPIEKLEAALTGNEAGSDAGIEAHIRQCSFCDAEMQLLRSFMLAEVPAEDEAAVAEIAKRLAAAPIVVTPPIAVTRSEQRVPWWRFGSSPLRSAILAFATLLLVAGVGLQIRRSSHPQLITETGRDIYRANTLKLLAPSGDLVKAPDEIRWEPIAAAVRYEVRVLEVDGNVLWSTVTSESHVAIPANIQSLMTPAKTLVCTVTAFDNAGRSIGESDHVRFRILQTIYPR